MKRTTVSLPDDVAEFLEVEARRVRKSMSELVRGALAARYNLEGPRRLPFESLGHSGFRHTARDMEDLLAREWGDEFDRAR